MKRTLELARRGVIFPRRRPAPTLSSVTPATGPEAGGTAVTLTCTGALPGCGVTFGGVAATSVVRVSSTEVTCVSPAGTAGAVDVVLTNPDSQTATLAGGWTYEAAGRTKSFLADGIDDQLTGTVALPAGSWTVEAWIKHLATVDGQAPIEIAAVSELSALGILTTAAGHIKTDVLAGGGDAEAFIDLGAVTPCTWHHVAITRSAGIAADVVISYLDGVPSAPTDLFATTGSGDLGLSLWRIPSLASAGPSSVARLAIHGSALDAETIAWHAADPDMSWGDPDHEWSPGNVTGDSTALPGGLIHDAVGTAHLTPVGTVAGSIVTDYPVAP